MEKLRKNQLVRAVIQGYNSAGMGVARVEDRAVFIPGGARGDAVLLRLLKAPESGPLFAKIEKLEEPSIARRQDSCPVTGRCGGCQFRHISYEEELSLKRVRVADALRRIGGIELIPDSVLPSSITDAYRNKAVFPVREVQGRAVTGFYRPRSHEIVPVDDCPLQNAEANACARALRNWMNRYRVPAYDEATGEGLIRHLYVRTGARSGQALCCVSATRPRLPQAPALVAALRGAIPGLTGILLDFNTRRDNVLLTGRQRLLWGRDRMEDELNSLRYFLSVMSFYQVNPIMAEALSDLVVRMAQLRAQDFVFELYCGVGTLTIPLAQQAAHVVGVDIVQDAIVLARENARINGVSNIAFRCADAGQAVTEMARGEDRPDVLVVDPPRKGLDRTSVQAIGQLRPARMVYVSCDPATLARDLKLLHEAADMEIKQCTPLDMFPRTANVECVAQLVQKE